MIICFFRIETAFSRLLQFSCGGQEFIDSIQLRQGTINLVTLARLWIDVAQFLDSHQALRHFSRRYQDEATGRHLIGIGKNLFEINLVGGRWHEIDGAPQATQLTGDLNCGWVHVTTD